MREAITTRLQKNPALKDYTPTRVELDESELLSLGRDDSTTYLDCSVELYVLLSLTLICGENDSER